MSENKAQFMLIHSSHTGPRHDSQKKGFFSLLRDVSFPDICSPGVRLTSPVVIRGTILELNETDQTILVQTDCEHAWCQVNVSGMYRGRIPSTAAFSSLKTGDMVETVFKVWYMDLRDPSTGYVNPSD
jgi:hypothetical protein